MSVKDKVTKIENRSEGAAPPAIIPELGPQTPTQEELPVTFEKWFKSRCKERGFKPHWVAGMQAFTNTNVPRPLIEWDHIFRSY